MKAKLLSTLEIIGLIALPIVLALCAFLQLEQSVLLTFLVAAFAIAIFFISFEYKKPALNQIVPVVVLAAIAACGRILCMALPNVQPVGAICIIAGIVLGRRNGFMVGALAMLASNCVLGQGAWTPWQMYSFGLIGFLAGAINATGAFKNNIILLVLGFASGLLYGAIMNSWSLIGFVSPITPEAAIATYAAGLPYDCLHGLSTVVFLAVLYVPWRKKIERAKSLIRK